MTVESKDKGYTDCHNTDKAEALKASIWYFETYLMPKHVQQLVLCMEA